MCRSRAGGVTIIAEPRERRFCFVFWQRLNAAQDETADLCRDAESWGRASDEISWGNNNTGGGGAVGWLRPGKSSCQLCLDSFLTSVRSASPPALHQARSSQPRLVDARETLDRGGSSEGKSEGRMWQGRGPVRQTLYTRPLTNNGTTATTSTFPARLCPVRVTGWTASRVACGSIPEPSEGRDPSCRDTGSHASRCIFLVVHKKAVHTPLEWNKKNSLFALKTQTSSALIHSFHGVLIVPNGALISYYSSAASP